MKPLIVVNREDDWPHEIPGVAVMSAKSYLTGEAANGAQYSPVVNLCRCTRTDDAGFYVSLLAEARGHHPVPTAKALEELRTPANVAAVREVEALAARAASGWRSFEVDAYFGADPAGENDLLCRQLFRLAGAPLLRATFRRRGAEWRLHALRALSPSDVPSRLRPALLRAATSYITGQPVARRPRSQQPSIAILYTPEAPLPPSNPAALEQFMRAGHALGLRVEIIDRHAIDRLGEFDALFMRDTTFLDHYTYLFAQRAAALGLVVIDHPDSILQCNNKVYLNELLARPAGGAEAARRRLLHRRAQGALGGRARAAGAAPAREVGADHRAGVPADRLRLARHGDGPARAFRLQVLHGAGPLAGA